MRNIIALLSISAFLFSCASSQPNITKKLEGLDHKEKSLSFDYKDKKNTVVVFLSSVCPCSNSHIKTLKALSNEFKETQFVGVHSNYTEDKTKAMAYFNKMELPFPIIYDKETEIAKRFGAVKTPHAFILNQQGQIIYNGAVTSSSNAEIAKYNYLEIALNDLKAGNKPSAPRRKTLGCYIPIKE